MGDRLELTDTENIQENAGSEQPTTELQETDQVKQFNPQVEHTRALVLGNSGSGKTTLAWYLASQSAYCLFLNPQRQNLVGYQESSTESWKEDLKEKKYIQLPVGVNFNLNEFIEEWHTEIKTLNIPEKVTLAIDEISLFGCKGKLSSPPWLTTVATRSRVYYNVVLTNHSTYQMPNFIFNQMSYIFFMRTGSSKAELDYLAKWFTPLKDPEMQEFLNKRYYFIVYDVNNIDYQPMNPIALN